MPARQDFPPNYYPFSDGLCLFMDNNPEFFRSLKLSNQNRFRYIPLIFTSHTPLGHPHSNDQVIGMWYLDINNYRQLRYPFFKQDFVVNVNTAEIEFVSYTTRDIVQRENSPFVRLINDFFRDYGNNRNFYHNGNRWQHHYDELADLPNEPRLRTMAQTLIASI